MAIRLNQIQDEAPMQQENGCKLRQTPVLTSKGPAKTQLLQVHLDCCCIWDVDTAGYSSSARALDKKCHPRCESQHFLIASNCCPCPSLPEGQHSCWQPLRETTAFLDGWVFLAVRELLSSVLWSPPVVFHPVTSWSISHDFHVSHDGSVLLLSQRDSIRTLKATLLKDSTQKRMEARVAHYLGTSPPGPTDILPLYNLIWGLMPLVLPKSWELWDQWSIIACSPLIWRRPDQVTVVKLRWLWHRIEDFCARADV